MSYTVKTSKFQIKESNDDAKTISGYASVFANLDGDNDTIHKGAFNRSIKSWGPEGKDRIKLMAQHDLGRPIAKITTLKEDDYGLYMEAKFGDWTDSKDYYAMMKDGVINEFSVGFRAIDKEENEKGGYDITQIKLYEISAVSIAANDKAVLMDVKSLDPMKLIKQVENDDLAFKLEREFLKLKSLAETTTQPVAEATPDSVVNKEEEYLLTLKNKFQ